MKILYDPLIQKLSEAKELARKLKRWNAFKSIKRTLEISGVESCNARTKEDFYNASK